MRDFWTCGPFKEAHDKIARAHYKAEQMKVFLEILEEDKHNQELLENGTADEKFIASLAQIEIDKKIATMLGVPRDGEKEANDEILRAVLLEHVRKRPKE